MAQARQFNSSASCLFLVRFLQAALGDRPPQASAAFLLKLYRIAQRLPRKVQGVLSAVSLLDESLLLLDLSLPTSISELRSLADMREQCGMHYPQTLVDQLEVPHSFLSSVLSLASQISSVEMLEAKPPTRSPLPSQASPAATNARGRNYSARSAKRRRQVTSVAPR